MQPGMNYRSYVTCGDGVDKFDLGDSNAICYMIWLSLMSL